MAPPLKEAPKGIDKLHSVPGKPSPKSDDPFHTGHRSEIQP